MTNVVCAFISAWAITLSVLQYRAMREPLDVGRMAEVPTLFLCRKKLIPKTIRLRVLAVTYFIAAMKMKPKLKLQNLLLAVSGCVAFISCGSGNTYNTYVPESTEEYFEDIEDFDEMYFRHGGEDIDDELVLYVDYSTCNVLGQNSSFYQALVPSWVDAAGEYYSIKGAQITKEKGNVFSLLKSITNYDYADLKTAAEKIADSDTEAVLLTDGEYFQKSIALGNVNNPYMKDAFAKWLKKGHDIYIFSEPYKELYHGAVYNKKRFYIIFTDSRLKGNIYDKITQTVKLEAYPQVEMFHLSVSHPVLSVNNSTHTLPNETLSAQVKGFGSFEAQEWQVDWENAIEPYIVNAVSGDTGLPLPDGAIFTGGLKIDRNSFGGYRITDVTVHAYDINREFTEFCNAKSANQKTSGRIDPVEFKNFVKIDEDEFNKHGVLNLHFDTQNFDPSILTGAPCTYFKLDICISNTENVFKQYEAMFAFDSIDQPGQQNVSLAESIKQCLAEPSIKEMMAASPVYTIYVKANKL